MTTYICDACYKHLVKDRFVYHVTDENVSENRPSSFLMGDCRELDIHLCLDCKRDLLDWLLSHKKHTEEINDG